MVINNKPANKYLFYYLHIKTNDFPLFFPFCIKLDRLKMYPTNNAILKIMIVTKYWPSKYFFMWMTTWKSDEVKFDLYGEKKNILVFGQHWGRALWCKKTTPGASKLRLLLFLVFHIKLRSYLNSKFCHNMMIMFSFAYCRTGLAPYLWMLFIS